jgi:tetratricopeptide (TPR) repeat protein
MGALMDAYNKARSGSGQVVGVVGEAGVGKSRLLLEFKNQLPSGEFAYLEGQCLHFGNAMAYLPVLDILRSYFKIKEGDQESRIKKYMEEKILQLDEKLHGILPSFHELLSLEIEEATYQKLEPQQKREKTFESLRDLFVCESQNRPIILVVEDLHWIDKTSEEFLSYLIEWLANTQILLILLYRPEYTHPWGSKSYYSQIGLSQLTSQSSAELIQAILYECDIEPGLESLILNRSAGTPLYIEELTHSLLENGSIQREQNQCFLVIEPEDIQIPDTIQGIIAARMDRLEDNTKRTMQIASVIGRDFAFRILETITEMREELKSYLLNLQGLEFIYEKSLFPELEYVFKHALTREVAYNSLLQKRRREIHDGLNELFNLAFLCLEYGSIGEYDQAFTVLYEGMAKAKERKNKFILGRLTNTLGCFHRELGDFSRALEFDRESMELGRMYRMANVEISALINLGFDQFALGQHERALSYLEPTLERVEREAFGSHRWRWKAKLPIGLAELSYVTGAYEQALRYVDEGLKVAQESSSQKYVAKGRALRGKIVAKLGDSDAAGIELQRAFTLAEQLRSPTIVYPAAYDLGQWYETTGQQEKAAMLYGKAKAAAEHIAATIKDETLSAIFLQSAPVQKIYDCASRLGSQTPPPALSEA